MISRSITNPRRHESYPRRLQTFPLERHVGLVRRPGGIISVPGRLPENGDVSKTQKLTKLLLNVNIERTFGPVQVVMTMEDTVRDLIRAAVEICVKEKRRPLLKETDPDLFQLHYSQFSLTSLKADDNLRSLRSRNFFLCMKPSTASSCSKGAKMANQTSFPFTSFMDFLL
ncbi:hypothetical protein HS088_TW16G00891 [Tripterygium wilfordii]|uniref:DUF7054 domain-containing protein n=1 Tax=Tripterygium wilfordii TaxID=458696 RepID=A0A7J7CK57_TRIWF|nr:uncharacterized protein At4g22758-like [Tripterygium wilfordii]KAF5734442.1 hypothetical protein HS088_TW16G00891 [Tripterygium wilfordii]